MKKKILGIPIVAFVLGIVLLGGASALLVTYLSNTTTETLTASSPLEMKFDDGSTSMNAEFYGGATITYKLWTENLGDVAVQAYPVTEITAPTGETWTGTEFTQVILKDPNYPSGIDVTSLMYWVKSDGSLGTMSTLDVEDLNTVKLFFDNNGDGVAQTYNRPVGFNEWNEISITMHPAISPGEYTIESCQLYDIIGECP